MGERSLAISNIVRSFYMVLMIPVWAFSTTANTLVSNNIGMGRKHLVLPIIWKITRISVFSVLVIVAPFLFIPDLVVRVYTPDTSLVADTITSLYVIFGAVVMFAITQNMFSGVSGTGNTRDALLIESFTLIIYLVVAWYIGIGLQQSITLVWLCEYVYFMGIGILSYLYLKSSRWQKKVI